MDQEMIRSEREKLEGAMKKIYQIEIKIAERLLELQGICKHPKYK